MSKRKRPQLFLKDDQPDTENSHYQQYGVSSGKAGRWSDDRFHSGILSDYREQQGRLVAASQHCIACEALAAGPYPYFHHTPARLAISARNGCRLCRLFLQVTQDSGNSRLSLRISRVGPKVFVKDATDKVHTLRLFRLSKNTRHNAVSNDEIDILPRRLDVTTALATACTRLESCLCQHTCCQPKRDSALPTRLLDLADNTIKVVHSLALAKNSKYVILSYCWGTSGHLMTTIETISAYQEGIRVEDIPQSIADAISVTRRLGVRYLWVDSLCIVQDSYDDWAAECARMAEYYCNSYVMLSALQSAGANEGFLNTASYTSAPRWPAEAAVYIRQTPQIFVGSSVNPPLSQRGWALQERILSSRIIHFHDEEVFYECDQQCLYNDSVVPLRLKTQQRDSTTQLKVRLLQILSAPDDSNAMLVWWYATVSHFTTRSLTNASDRLPALQGIASVLQPRMQLQYSLGSWLPDVFGLIWRCTSESKARSDIQVANSAAIPSWSWTSSSGRVVYPSQRAPFLDEAQILVSASTDDHVLTIHALTQEVHLHPAQLLSHNDSAASSRYRELECEVAVNAGPGRKAQRLRSRLSLILSIDSGLAQWKSSVTCRAVLICASHRTSETYGEAIFIDSILVVPDPKREGVMKRIGLWSAERSCWRDALQHGDRSTIRLG